MNGHNTANTVQYLVQQHAYATTESNILNAASYQAREISAAESVDVLKVRDRLP